MAEQMICNICNGIVTNKPNDRLFRDSAFCQKCRSMVRERSLVYVLEEELKLDLSRMKCHESSPSRVMNKFKQVKGYDYSHYFPGVKSGDMHNGVRCVDLNDIPFPENTFDLVFTLDVFEHLYTPDIAAKELFRVVKPGGIYAMCVPFENGFCPTEKACNPSDSGPVFIPTERAKIKGLNNVEWHGNPVLAKGSVVTYYWSYEGITKIFEDAGFHVDIYFTDKDVLKHGIAGIYNEVVICRKPLKKPSPENLTADKRWFLEKNKML